MGNIKSLVPDLVVQINYSLMSLWFTFHNIVLSNQKHICSVCEPSEDMVLCVTFELQLCEYYDCCLVQKYVISVTPFQLLKLLSYCIYQKSMSVYCKLYFHSLHIKKSFGNQNLTLSCLRAYCLVIFYKHGMYECLCTQFQH